MLETKRSGEESTDTTAANKQADTEMIEKQAEKTTLLCLDTHPKQQCLPLASIF